MCASSRPSNVVLSPSGTTRIGRTPRHERNARCLGGMGCGGTRSVRVGSVRTSCRQRVTRHEHFKHCIHPHRDDGRDRGRPRSPRRSASWSASPSAAAASAATSWPGWTRSGTAARSTSTGTTSPRSAGRRSRGWRPRRKDSGRTRWSGCASTAAEVGREMVEIVAYGTAVVLQDA